MNPRLAQLEPSLIRQMHALKQAGDVDLGLGEPVVAPPIEPFRRATEWIERNGCRYSPTPGYGDLREAVARYLDVTSEQVVITHGSQEALYLALRVALDPRVDEVLIVEPAYPAPAKMCDMEGIAWRSVGLDEDSFEPDAARVLSALRPQTRMVILSSPCNPTGRLWPREALLELMEGLEGRYLLLDEVYRELHYGALPPPVMGNRYDRTIVVGGLSKSHAMTGLRLGWISTPPDLAAATQRAHQLLTTSASSFAQRVALELFNTLEGMGMQRHLYAQRRIGLLSALALEGLEHVEPDGTFYCMVRIPPGSDRYVDSLEVAKSLLDVERVVTIPGVAFGQSSAGWLRVSWVGEPRVVADGLHRIASFFAYRR
jgi:aspartate/methionine/tyrosine aminotransferase